MSEKPDLARYDLAQFTDKQLEFKIIRDVLSKTWETFMRRDNEHKKECKELNELHYDVWAAEDSFCKQVWDFSKQHDFHEIFNKYPNIPKPTEHNDCSYGPLIMSSSFEKEIENNATVEILRKEISDIQEEILQFPSDIDVKQNIKRYLIELDELRLFSQEASQLIRLINAEGGACNKEKKQSVSNREEKAPNEDEKAILLKTQDVYNPKSAKNCSKFIIAKKLMQHPKLFSQQLIQKKDVSVVLKTPVIRLTKLGDQKRRISKFIVKKKSIISTKVEEKWAQKRNLIISNNLTTE